MERRRAILSFKSYGGGNTMEVRVQILAPEIIRSAIASLLRDIRPLFVVESGPTACLLACPDWEERWRQYRTGGSTLGVVAYALLTSRDSKTVTRAIEIGLKVLIDVDDPVTGLRDGLMA